MITMLYAGLCTILVVLLALRVVQFRFRHKIGLGDGGNPELLRRMRAHANAVENLPLALLLLGGMELNGYPGALIHGFGATLLVSRAAHAWGLSHRSGTSRGRFLGSLFTWLLMLAMALFAIGGFLMQYNAPPG
jgi:uncharacterized membrane protein YecN with MAPEG domain